MTFVGRSVTRLEDRPLVTGRGRFAADVAFPRMLHMRVVRSAHAHGRIVSIDTSAALALPGVAAAWTSADVSPISLRSIFASPASRAWRPIASPFWPGSACAMSASRSPRCLRLIPMWRRTQPISSPSRSTNCRSSSMPPRRPGEFEDGRSTEPAIVEKSYGDIVAAFRDAHAVVELDLAIGRHSGVPLETRGAIARYDAASDVLELHGAAKVPHWNRDNIARMLGRDPASVHLFEGHVGGGFGIRGELYPEDVLVCLAALRLGRPVKWIEDRREHLIAANHSRAAAPQGSRRGRRRGPHSRHRRRVLPRPGRLCPHPRGHRARSCRRDVAGPISGAGVSGDRSRPAHQQDAGRDLSRARDGSKARSCASG